ncbi:class I SAM-dependent methyltransferase [Rapidithrix thailandica]|uniref:Class I SAM-dependent methyltransferase n=1 Tax=Rapidithrix thailandica TaxID=413964 RepID=A0AAW9S998_9BACT
MKQNKYDDSAFFERYSQMPRSIKGLNAAGEWYVLHKMLPDLTGKNMLDLGCGYGWHCIYAKEQGAKRVVGVDLSQKMIEKAKEKSGEYSIEYKQMPIEDIDFVAEEFDVVFSSLAFHYIQDLKTVFHKIHACLKKGGQLVFSIEHPVFTARAEQDWYVEASGNRLHWPLDHYQTEGERHTRFLGHQVIKYHRTLETIINTLIASNFEIIQLSEPKPSQEVLKEYPEMKDEMRRPIFLLVSAIKK